MLLIWIAGSFVACNPFLSTPQTQSTTSILAYFSFDKNADDTINKNLKGTVYGAKLTKGIKGNGYVFDGIDDYIEIENSNQSFNFDYTDTYSISFWVKPTQLQNDLAVHENDLLSKWVAIDSDTTHLKTGYPFCIRYLNQKSGNRTGRFYLANWGGYIEDCESGNKIVSESKLTNDQFHHLVFTQSKTKLTVYLNGKLVSTNENTSICPTKNNAPLRIGKRGGLKYQNHFSGVIDELRFFNVALSEETIQLLNRLEY